ncbi:MAG: hypothetical protein ACP5E9_05540, partial [Candidatus Methanospirareceae archaeon]
LEGHEWEHLFIHLFGMKPDVAELPVKAFNEYISGAEANERTGRADDISTRSSLGEQVRLE